MKYSLHFLPDVEDDILTGYSWYEEKAIGLGEDFIRMFYTGVNEIQRGPLLLQKTYNEFRRRLLRRFPYAIYFKIEKSRIIIFGLFHCARDPRFIKTKLSNRDDPE